MAGPEEYTVTDPDGLERLRRVLRLGSPGEPESPSASCLDDDTIAALADGTIDPDSRQTALPHLASCLRCRRAVASVARALTDRTVAAEIRTLAQPGRGRVRRVLRVAAPLAAAGLVLLLAWPPSPAPDARLHRAPTITAGPIPVPLFPIGASLEPRHIGWTGVPGADRYRVTVFDGAGNVVYEVEQADTSVFVPDSVGFVPGRLYLWKVEARSDIGRWTSSDLVEFSPRPRPIP